MRRLGLPDVDLVDLSWEILRYRCTRAKDRGLTAGVCCSFARERPLSRPRTADFRGRDWQVDVGGAFDRRSIMAMVDFAVLAVKVLFFIWAAQLIWIGSTLLEGLAERALRSMPTSEILMKKAAQALRSSF
jgi:hypothetical protein